jgi:hypothetical protein
MVRLYAAGSCLTSASPDRFREKDDAQRLE